MLPVNPIGLGNSPYTTTCSFAGEPLYIDLEGLVKDGLLKKSEIVTPQAVSPNRIYYQKARRYRKSRLKAAFERFTAGHGDLESSPFYQFRSEHKYWLEDFALFCVLSKKFKTRHWPNWPSDVRRRKKAALAKVRSAFKKELDFIGFYRYWEIKAETGTARKGRFRKTPGHNLFQAVKSSLGTLPFIAEDLGTVVPEVYALRDKFGLPGMRILQFGFGNETSAQYHLPFNYIPNSVVYTGTHDNNTVVGWYGDAQKDARKKIRKYNFNLCQDYIGAEQATFHWAMIRETMKSVANLSIFPMQDILGLNEKARMNIPGEAAGNWQWRLEDKSLTKKLIKRLRKETQTFNRLP
jgi:4-alpha-glucanotransferase